MARILTFLTGRNLPKIAQAGDVQASIITQKTIRDFTRVVEDQRADQRSRAIKAEIERLDRLFRE